MDDSRFLSPEHWGELIRELDWCSGDMALEQLSARKKRSDGRWSTYTTTGREFAHAVIRDLKDKLLEKPELARNCSDAAKQQLREICLQLNLYFGPESPMVILLGAPCITEKGKTFPEGESLRK